MKTQKEAIEWINKSIGKQYDEDGWYGFQCVDYVNAYYKFLTGRKLYGQGAKDIPFANDFTNIATVQKNTLSFLAKAGDIVVWGASMGNGYGHTGVVIEATLERITIVEQNWLIGGWTQGNAKGGTGWEKATKRTHEYSSDMWFIRPNFKTSVATKAKKAVKKVVKKVTPKKKGKRILLVAGHGKGYYSNDCGAVGNGTNERDFIRTNIVPNVAKYLKQVGHTVSYYGGSTMNQDLFQDTRYGVAVKDNKNYGLYWVKKQKYDVIIEFHLDAASPQATGGHVIIGTNLDADTIDIGIQQALRKSVGLIREIDRRDNLLNVVTAKKLNLNYRLVELGFITSKKDMDYIKKNIQVFTKSIAEAIHGESIKGVSTQPVKVTKKVVKKKPKVQKKPIKKVAKSKQTYKVKKGDSLWLIANKYKVTVDYLKKLNDLKSDRIFVNQILIIKK